MDPVLKATLHAREQREQRERGKKRKADQARFAEQAKREREARVRRELKKAGLICPACGTTNVTCLKRADRNEALSLGAAMSALTNDPACLGVAFMASDKKSTMLCMDCGKKYKC